MATDRAGCWPDQRQTLLHKAREARANAHAPYSLFRVGAAVLTEDGSIFQGVNVENASYGLTVCAERNAVFTAVTAGHKHIRAVAVYTGVEGRHGAVPSCGACLQVLAEFMDDDGVIILGNGESFTLRGLLPMPFRLKKS